MNKNEDKKSLNDNEIEKVSGGKLTNMVAYGGPCKFFDKRIMVKYGGPRIKPISKPVEKDIADPLTTASDKIKDIERSILNKDDENKPKI